MEVEHGIERGGGNRLDLAAADAMRLTFELDGGAGIDGCFERLDVRFGKLVTSDAPHRLVRLADGRLEGGFARYADDGAEDFCAASNGLTGAAL